MSGPSGPVVVVDEGYEGVTQDEGRQLLAVRCRFVAPNISGDGKYVGWLAAYPELGASYAMTAELAVLDLSQRLHYFHGDWGLVSEWCAPNRPGEVVFAELFSWTNRA